MTRSSDCWYVDSSVALRIHLRHSPAAIAWFNERLDAGDRMVSSHLMLVEVVQVSRREGLDLAAAYDFVALFDLAAIDERLARRRRASIRTSRRSMRSTSPRRSGSPRAPWRW